MYHARHSGLQSSPPWGSDLVSPTGRVCQQMKQTENALLNWDVFITPGIPFITSTPNTKETFWHPISSTLIYGKRDAVLVDLPPTWQQAVILTRWVRDSCKNLTTIYVTHGHADHWFGVSGLLDRFPNAKVVTTPGTVKVMREQAEPDYMKNWNAYFPGQIPNQLVIAEELGIRSNSKAPSNLVTAMDKIPRVCTSRRSD